MDLNALMRDIVKNTGGKDVSGAMTAAEALGAGGLDWRVEKKPVAFQTATGGWWPVDGKFAVVRQGEPHEERPLGIVGDVYTPLQNAEAFSFFDAIVQEKAAIYRAAGSFKGGANVWILAEIPREIRVGPDPMSAFVLLKNSHDGSSCVRLSQVVYRQVCTNGMVAATEESRFTFRHSSQMGQKVEAAREAIGVMSRTLDDFLAGAEHLVRMKSNQRTVESLLEVIGKPKASHSVRAERRREDDRIEIMRLMESGRGNDVPGVKGTLWAAVNGITEWVDHVWKRRTDETRAMSNWFGEGARIKTEAFEHAKFLSGRAV